MIKMTLEDVMAIAPALQDISNKSFSGATTFKIARLIRELNKEIETFDTERMKLIEKYGERDETGKFVQQENNSVKIKDEYIQICNQEIIGLFKTEIEVNAERIPIEVFDGIEMTPSQAMNFEPIVDFK